MEKNRENISNRDSNYQFNLTYQKAMNKILNRFIFFGDSFDKDIYESLKEIGKLTGASRSYIFLFRNNLKIMDNVYEWCEEGVLSEKENLQNLPSEILPWWMAKLLNRQVIYIEDVSKMPVEANSEKKILERQKIKALIVLPMYCKEKLNGFIGFDNVNENSMWKEDDYMLLKFISRNFGSIFERKYYEQQLLEKNKLLQSNIIQIKNLQNHVIEQEKMIGIGMIAAGLAHEINSPIGVLSSELQVLFNYIKSFKDFHTDYCYELKNKEAIKLEDVEKMLEKYDIRYILSDVGDLIDSMGANISRIATIIRSLRNFSKDSFENQVEEIEIEKVISNMWKILDSEIDREIKLVKNYKHVNLLKGDSSLFGRSIIHILRNGIQAIEMKRIDNGKIEIKSFENDKYLYISFIDNGIGIKKDEIKYIFNPFYTRKDDQKALGLGLSIVYDIIVNTHKGSIFVYSKENLFTKITIRFNR